MELSSEFGKGSTFTVTVPLQLDAKQAFDSDSSTLPLDLRKARLASLGIWDQRQAGVTGQWHGPMFILSWEGQAQHPVVVQWASATE